MSIVFSFASATVLPDADVCTVPFNEYTKSFKEVSKLLSSMTNLIPYFTPVVLVVSDLTVNVLVSLVAPGNASFKSISAPSAKVIVPIFAVFTITDLALSFPLTLAVKYANVAFLLICGYYPIILIAMTTKKPIFTFI